MTSSTNIPLPEHDGWLRRIAGDTSLDALSRWQASRILRSIPPNVPTVALYCPTKSFRGLFGRLPEELERRGVHVLKLYSERHHDQYENHPHAFRVWGDIFKHLGFINIFIVPTIMDCLPAESTKVLLLHTSFSGVPFSGVNTVTGNADRPRTLSDEELVEYYTHMTAFWPLFDYFLAATPDICKAYEKYFWKYDRPPLNGHQTNITAQRTVSTIEDAQRLLDLLGGKPTPNKQCVIPFGYPSLDQGMSRAATSTRKRNTITYAPTPLVGKPGWEPFASARSHGQAIITRLLEAFPDIPVVYKPYADELEEITAPVLSAGGKFPNFIHDTSGGHYQDLYNQTAVMVSDFSGAAYTFALGQSQPVVFFSPLEDSLPENVKQCEFCQNRQWAGMVATNLDQLESSIRNCLAQAPSISATIRSKRESVLFNPGKSAEYLADHFDYLLQGIDHPDWFYFGQENSGISTHKLLSGQFDAWQSRNEKGLANANMTMKRAIHLLNVQQIHNALDILRKGYAQAPDSETIAGTLAHVEMLLNRPDRALEPSFRAFEMNPREARYQALLTSAMHKLNPSSNALKQNDETRGLSPTLQIS